MARARILLKENDSVAMPHQFIGTIPFILIKGYNQESIVKTIFVSHILLNRYSGKGSNQVDHADKHITHLANNKHYSTGP